MKKEEPKEIFKISKEYQKLSDIKKLGMLTSLLDWGVGEVNKIWKKLK